MLPVAYWQDRLQGHIADEEERLGEAHAEKRQRLDQPGSLEGELAEGNLGIDSEDESISSIRTSSTRKPPAPAWPPKPRKRPPGRAASHSSRISSMWTFGVSVAEHHQQRRRSPVATLTAISAGGPSSPTMVSKCSAIETWRCWLYRLSCSARAPYFRRVRDHLDVDGPRTRDPRVTLGITRSFCAELLIESHLVSGTSGGIDGNGALARHG